MRCKWKSEAAGEKISYKIKQLGPMSGSGGLCQAVRILPFGGKSHDLDTVPHCKSLKIWGIRLELYLHLSGRAYLQFLPGCHRLGHQPGHAASKHRSADYP